MLVMVWILNANLHRRRVIMLMVHEIETTDTDQSTRSSRRRTPNRKYDNDYISPIINRRGLSNALSLKRCLSSSSDSISVSLKENPIRDQHKKVKQFAPSTSDKEQNVFNKPPRVPKPQCIAELGTLTLKWPKYGINNGIYDGQSFSVTRTCPIDTGLFALYHAYKAGSDKFQKLFENDNLDALVVLRDTFKYVETNDWTVARLHWLVRHQLLNEKISDGRYDLKNTLTKIVFDYVRPMQIFEIISECSCIACPQRIRKNSSVDITLRKIDGKFPNYMDSFINDYYSICGSNIGSTEPSNYPAEYIVDNHFPVIDLSTNKKRTE
ncbi:unnamed protein product [Rotaria socialis]|uniref:Uncharacterized protein n=2 Tax=Rotaria socialis TaxID=392032 RepID=A0A821S3U9_9BILA|nr:unnamed protein product [Rotaria socialis]